MLQSGVVWVSAIRIRWLVFSFPWDLKSIFMVLHFEYILMWIKVDDGFAAVDPLEEKIKITWLYFLGYVSIHIKYYIVVDEYWITFSFNVTFAITLRTTFIKDDENE